MIPQMQCESCLKEFNPDELKSFKRFDFLCPECYVKESALPHTTPTKPELAVQYNPPVMNEVAKEYFRKREEFFNAEHTSIAEITGNNFERAAAIKERITKWKAIVFEANSHEYQAFYELQQLSIHLTKEEREKLNIADHSYQPANVKPEKPKQVRMSKQDRALVNMANALFGKQLGMLDIVNKQCFAEHASWWSNGHIKQEFMKEYKEYVDKHGALTEEMAIEKVSEVVRSSRAQNFQQLASGERSLSDPISADSDRK